MTEYVFERTASGSMRFVGDFDKLYLAEDDPWGQSGDGEKARFYAVQRPRLSGSIFRYAKPGIGLDIGCGLGVTTDFLDKRSGCSFQGLDISWVAIQKASEKYPGLKFTVGDISTDDGPTVPEIAYDVVVMNNLLWYVLERLEPTIRNAVGLVKPGGLFVVSQAFLIGEQRYGAEIADGFSGALYAISKLLPGKRLIEAHCSEVGGYGDGLMVWKC